jgi:hypothetical protein
MLENVGIPELAELVALRPRVLGPVAPASWRDEISIALFMCPLWVEAAFCVLEHGVLLTSDLCFEADSDPRNRSWFERLKTLPLQVRVCVRERERERWEGGVCLRVSEYASAHPTPLDLYPSPSTRASSECSLACLCIAGSFNGWAYGEPPRLSHIQRTQGGMGPSSPHW